MTVPETPGDFAFWLSRASLDDLHRVRADEIAKGGLVTRWRVVVAIDEELSLRDAQIYRALSSNA